MSAPFALDVRKYFQKSGRAAKNALKDLGWTGWTPDPHERGFADLFSSIGTPEAKIVPNPLQNAAIDIGDDVGRPMLAIVEAPMGEGKTEAAMYLADRFAARLGQRGCYFALPTQATSNQMFTRVREFLKGRYPDKIVNLQLLHGHAALNAEFQGLLQSADAEPECVCEDKDLHDHRPSVIAAEWFTYRKRGLLAPFGVGTVDQALLAVLQTRHVFVRLFGLAHKTVIIDEVHAYDAYMTTLLERLLEWLAALGSSVVLLSATLPKARRDALASAYVKGLGGNIALPPDERYPRLTWVGQADSGSRHVETSERSSRKLSLQWIDGAVPKDGDAFPLGERLRVALEAGGCAAVICNTVTQAQKVYLALKEYFVGSADDGEPILDLLHARFLFKDRDEREKRCLVRFGKPGAVVDFGDNDLREVRRPNRAVLVATQVIEQSLDLDFDLMVTDHAPVDLILQRAGRLHRHQRADRPTLLAAPQLFICSPDLSENGLPNFGRANTAVYDEHLLLRSWFELKDRNKIAIPTEVEDLIESVYDDKRSSRANLSPQLADHWDKTAEALIQKRDEYEGKARQNRIASAESEGLLEDFNRDLDEDDPSIHPTLQALTRLSGPTAQLVLLSPEQIDLTHHPMDRQGVRTLLEHSVTVSHRGIVRMLLREEENTPLSWRKNALLRHHRLIRIDETRRAHIGRYMLHLNAELGLTIIDPSRKSSDGDI
jgi:CRISPR-associated endonuclease/helicase Cas3